MRPSANRPWQENPATFVVQTDGLLGTARVLHRAGPRLTDDPKTAQLCVEAGQFGAPFTASDTPANRVLGAWLIAIFAGICMVALVVQSLGRTPAPTAQMERLAAQLDLATTIPARTADEIVRALAQPAYDCAQVACGSELQARNKAARDHLKRLLATKAIAAGPRASERMVGSARGGDLRNSY
jgi:hypothetical protein